MEINKDDLIKAGEGGLKNLPAKGAEQIKEYLEMVYKSDKDLWVPISAMKKQISLGEQRIRHIVNSMVENKVVEASNYGQKKVYRLLVEPST